jgi:hypothetical protein
MLAKQAFYHLSYTPRPFGFSYFSDGVSSFSPGPASDHNPPTNASYVARITDVHLHPSLFVEIGLSLTFLVLA